MRSSLLKLAILGTLGFVSSQAFALGLEPLAAAPTGSAYINCYNKNRVTPSGGVADNVKGNFGSYPIPGANLPSTTVNNTCFIAKPASELTSPKTGYTIAGSRTVTIPTTTGGTGNIGSLVDYVWRKPAATAPATPTDMCIFGARATMISADHDSVTAGTQFFEINDIARGGYSASGSVNVGYTLFSTTGNTSPLYRVGRTFTSVQHRALKYDTNANKELNGTGYLDLPTIGGLTTLNINGVNSTIGSTAAASVSPTTLQDAQVNSNWVDFTADTVFADDDGSTNALSGFTYIEAACNSTAVSGWIKTGAIRLRQTAQENATFKEIAIDGYAPPGATVP